MAIRRIFQQFKQWRTLIMQTPEQKRAKQKAYREANKEKVKEIQKQCYLKNREKVLKKQKDRRDNNKEKVREIQKKCYLKNRENVLANQKHYRKNNKEKIKNRNVQNEDKLKKYHKKYNQENKEKINISKRKRKKERLKSDSLYKLKTNTRHLIKNAIINKGYKKNTKTEQILGCTFEFFKNYIEAQFNEWQNWNNWGAFKKGESVELRKYWQIDHIIPLCSAKTEEDVIRLNHYTNLQVLDAYINLIIKGSKLDYSK